MKYTNLTIPGLVLIEPDVFTHNSADIFETYRGDLFKQHIGNIDFMQDNEARLTRGTLRGLRYQLPPFEQNKLVRVVTGAILDIAADIRKASPFFGRYILQRLDDTYHKKLFVPAGFAHGYLVLSKTAIIQTKVDRPYSRHYTRGIDVNDPQLNISLPFTGTITKHEPDRNLPLLKDAEVFDLYKLYEGRFAGAERIGQRA